jgi:hypothetical protein
MVPPPATVALEKSLCRCAVGLTSPLTSKNFDLVAQIQSVNSLFVLYEDIDTVEVCGSSPHGPTILSMS